MPTQNHNPAAGSRPSQSPRGNDEAIRKRNREASARIFRRDGVVALLVFAVVSVLFLATMSAVSQPGDSADWLAVGSGLRENFTARHFVWRKFLGLVVAFAPASQLSLFANTCFALVSAVAIALLYMVASQFTALGLDREFLDTKAPGLADRRIASTSLASGLVAAAVLALSAPFWSSAAQVRLENFHLAWLLAAALCLLRFANGGSLGWLWAFAVLEGAGAAQQSCFIAWGAPFLLYAAWLLWTRDKLNAATGIGFAAALVVPFAVVLGAAVSSHMNSAAVLVYAPDTQAGEIVRHLLRALTAGVMSTFGQAWWLILVGLTVLPCASSLAVSRSALNGEGGIAKFMLHIAIAVTTLCVVLDMRFSPWKLAPGDYQIVPYAMTAISAGYIVAWLFSRATFSCLPSRPNVCAFRSRVIAAVAVVVIAVSAVRNWSAAAPGRLDFVRNYCDTVLESLQGRDWLFSNGVFDSNLRLRAHERGVGLDIVNLAQPGGLRSTSGFRDDLPDVRLRNVAEIGPSALLREWISNRADAGQRVALSVVPDLWHQGPWADWPSGPVFLGYAPEEVDAKIEDGSLAEDVRKALDAADSVLKSVPEDQLPRLRWMATLVRHSLSLSGNNAGFLLETHGRSEEAFQIYARVHEFDPDNVSAVLNWVSMIRGGLHPELRDEAVKVLEDLRQRRADKGDNIWSLAATCGYVSSPVAFANLGWTWALSGQPSLAANSLGRAMRQVDPGDQTRLRAVLASVYMRGGQFDKSEEEFKRILEEDPGAPNAILGLVRISALRGDFAEARKRLESAVVSGVPQERVIFERGAIDVADGDFVAAEADADELVALDSRSIEARTLRSAVALARYTAAPDGADGDHERAAALDALSAVVADLEKFAGPDDVRTIGPRARLAELEGRWNDARADWTQVLRQTPDAESVSVRESILRADFSLADKGAAAAHAREMLARSPENPFANYILGSLALEKENLASAEDFLRRTLENSPGFVPALNDLADAELSLGKYDEAEALVKQLFATGSDLYAAWDTLAMVRLAKGDKDGALEAIERSLQLDADHDLRVTMHYAKVLAEAGRHEQAVTIMRDLMPHGNEFRGRDARDFSALATRLRIGR